MNILAPKALQHKLIIGGRRWGIRLKTTITRAQAEPQLQRDPASAEAAAAAAAARAAQQRHHTAAPLRERIAADGSLRVGSYHQHHQSQQQSQQQQQLPRPPWLAAAAPLAPPCPQEAIESLADLISNNRRVLVITGAGCSTESNIPDYRGPGGAYTTGFTPMTHAQFMRSEESRARYWHRSFMGWGEFAHVEPNAAHESLARLMANGWVGSIISQNVDRLHHKGGAPPSRVIELHGTTHRVVCMACGDESCRHAMQRRLEELNPEAAALLAATLAAGDEPGRWKKALSAGTAADARATTQGGQGAARVPVRRPDGDVELVDAGLGFVVPPCPACGAGPLKPAVTFFGDSVPPARAQEAAALAANSDVVIAVGTSLMVWSAFRLAKAAKEAGAKLALVCVGETRADGICDLKVGALAGEVMARLAAHPRLLLPRVG